MRASLLRRDVQVKAINHTCTSIEDVIHLILHDSTHGSLQKLLQRVIELVALPNGNICLNGHEIALISERNLQKIDWNALDVDYVAEGTGKFRSVASASLHVTSGKAKKVLISAPSPDAPTFVYKINSENYVHLNETNSVYSCASCTTNCLAPIAKVLNEEFGIVPGFMTTVHASTQSQHVLDGYSRKDRRSGRSIIGNIIPTTTGAAKALKSVLPCLDGKVSGVSVRVPTANVSMVDLSIQLEKPTSLDEIMATFHTASKGELQGILDVEEEELVSCDFLGHPCSAIVDAKASVALNPHVSQDTSVT